MQDFRNYFKNPFDTFRISDDNLRKFSQDHVQRLKANNSSGVYTTILEATEPLVSAFGKGINDEDIRRGIKKGNTLKTNQVIRLFKKTMARREGAVRNAFGEDSPEYLKFFPNGLKQYTLANKNTINSLMVRMETLTAEHVAELGAAIAAEFADIRSNYELSRNSQLQAFGTMENLRTATATARQALVAQLCVNLLYIASKNVGHPDRLDDFMDQSIIRPR